MSLYFYLMPIITLLAD